jgi:hypothetical protein
MHRHIYNYTDTDTNIITHIHMTDAYTIAKILTWLEWHTDRHIQRHIQLHRYIGAMTQTDKYNSNKIYTNRLRSNDTDADTYTDKWNCTHTDTDIIIHRRIHRIIYIYTHTDKGWISQTHTQIYIQLHAYWHIIRHSRAQTHTQLHICRQTYNFTHIDIYTEEYTITHI